MITWKHVLLVGVLYWILNPMMAQSTRSPLDYVNPLIGTDSEFKLSNGNTYPAIALPWGMNFWTPQTGPMGDGWGYTYDAYQIQGFKQTHQPSPWINDYGAFSLMPITDTLLFAGKDRGSWFSHKRETARPDYYQVYLSDYDVWTEITPTERAAQFRFQYPTTEDAYLLVDAFDEGSFIEVFPEQGKVRGYASNNSGGVPENFRNYFVLYLDQSIKAVDTWQDSTLFAGELRQEGNHTGAVLHLTTQKGQSVNVRIASSFISWEQAELNLAREIGTDDFNTTRAKARAVWEQELGRLAVTGGSEADRINFYTALYRLLLFPRSFYEYDATGNIMHYSPYNGEVLPGYMFTDNGFWDTFRAVFPFFTVMYRELDARIMEGLANAYQESGWLPEWASPGHRDCMIGSNSAAIIADAYLKGIRNIPIEVLYEAIWKNTQEEGPLSSVGRYGVEYYNNLGYIPYNVGIRENAARTLEYSYADFTIWKLAQALGRPKAEVALLAKRAQNYQLLYDPETRFMRGKNEDGTFQAPFRPDKWGDAFTEGSSWHYTWSVFHDPQGLINLMGGKEAFVDKLDAVFSSPPTYDCSYYGFPIHEITEMQIAGMGQYAHGNQPIQHAIYLYNYAGTPWKAQARLREVMRTLYTPTPDGLCGDEDNGQTSAWFVFSALGFYPVCPGSGQYVLGSPLFDSVTLHLENGKHFTVQAVDNSPSNVYIQQARLNGKPWTANWLSHETLLHGGELRLQMGPQPNFQRGTTKADQPYSMSNE